MSRWTWLRVPRIRSPCSKALARKHCHGSAYVFQKRSTERAGRKSPELWDQPAPRCESLCTVCIVTLSVRDEKANVIGRKVDMSARDCTTHSQRMPTPSRLTLCVVWTPSSPWLVESAVLYVVIPRSRLFLHDAILLVIHPVVDVEHPSVTEIIAVTLNGVLVMNASTVISVCFVSFAKLLATSTAKQWTPGS